MRILEQKTSSSEVPEGAQTKADPQMSNALREPSLHSRESRDKSSTRGHQASQKKKKKTKKEKKERKAARTDENPMIIDDEEPDEDKNNKEEKRFFLLSSIYLQKKPGQNLLLQVF